MGSESIPPDDFEIEAVRDQLRVAERKLALAEAQLAISRVARVAPPPGSLPEGAQQVSAALDVLFHTALVAMVLLSNDGTILRANAPAAELWGIPLADLPGRRTVEFTVPEDVDDTESRLHKSQRNGQFLLKTYVRPDGAQVPCLALGWPLVDDEGAYVCILGAAIPLERIATAPSMLEQVLAAAGRRVADADGA